MKRYQAVLEASAQTDIEKSFLWGCRHWGRKQAMQWVRKLRQAAESLATLPEHHPVAPEAEEFSEPIRHLIIDRYRVLFLVKGKKVYVLHVRGAYFDVTAPEAAES